MAFILNKNAVSKKLTGLLKLQLLLCILTLVASVPAGASSEKFIAVSCGTAHTIALSENGTVWAWGRIYEQAPDPSSFNGTVGQRINSTHLRIDAYVISHDQLTPIQVPIDNVVAIATGDSFSLALKRDGTVWAWGDNEFGALGDGTSISTPIPVQVKNLDDVVAISAGGGHSIALKKDGTVWAWGINNHGQLGDGTYISRWMPVRVEGLSNIKAIYCGSFAVKDDGSVWTWGPTIKDASMADTKPIPYPISNLKNITYIDADIAFSHTILVRDDGTVWSWGDDYAGQLGDGTHIYDNPPYVSVPVQVKGLDSVKMVQAGERSSMALKSDGTVWAWGSNGGGQLGLGNISITNPQINPLPVEVKSVKNVIGISSKTMVSAFLTSDGSVWMAGEDFAGQIGDGSKKADTAVTLPVKVLGPDDIPSTTASAGEQQSWQQDGYSGIILALGALVVVAILGCASYLIYKKR